jgi:hypothetical protein
MPDEDAGKGLRDRLTYRTEDRLGKALTDLFDNRLVNGALGRASDAREKAAQAQELAMGALNLPSAADIERLTRRLRSVSQRLEGIEDGVHRLGRTLSSQSVEARLAGIEEQLESISGRLEGAQDATKEPAAKRGVAKKHSAAKRSAARRPVADQSVAGQSVAKQSVAKQSVAKRPVASESATARTPGKGTAATVPEAKRS